VHPWDCQFYIVCWNRGNGVETLIGQCGDGDYFFQDDWQHTFVGVYCAPPNRFECPFEEIFWPPVKPN
jgi:hypothetical protein